MKQNLYNHPKSHEHTISDQRLLSVRTPLLLENYQHILLSTFLSINICSILIVFEAKFVQTSKITRTNHYWLKVVGYAIITAIGNPSTRYLKNFSFYQYLIHINSIWSKICTIIQNHTNKPLLIKDCWVCDHHCYR